MHSLGIEHVTLHFGVSPVHPGASSPHSPPGCSHVWLPGWSGSFQSRCPEWRCHSRRRTPVTWNMMSSHQHTHTHTHTQSVTQMVCFTVNGRLLTLPTEKQLSPGLTAPVSTWWRFMVLGTQDFQHEPLKQRIRDTPDLSDLHYIKLERETSQPPPNERAMESGGYIDDALCVHQYFTLNFKWMYEFKYLSCNWPLFLFHHFY